MVAQATNVTETLRMLRQVIDEREQLAAQDKVLSERKSALEAELLNFHASTGLNSCAGAGLSVTFDDGAVRAKYDPSKWADIVKWAVSTGNDHIIQRRLTDAKVIDLIENGTALPEGLTVESYTKLSTRRK
jgi:uncharacterized protein YlxW (UPF0749 family)